MKHIAVIGNGIAGITTARTLRKLDDQARISVISAETEFFFSRTALMYVYMGHMTFEDTQPYENWFWAQNRIDLIQAYVDEIDTEQKTLNLSTGRTLGYDVLVLAVGSTYNLFGWPGQHLAGVQGLVNKQDLDDMERNTVGVDQAVVVGGGLIGVEMTEMLHARHIPVTFLVREQKYMDYLLPAEEADLVGREIRRHGIDLRLGTELKEIMPDETGRVQAVVTNHGEEISCQFVGLTAGVHPNIKMVKPSSVETNRGILVNNYFETNIPDVYAVGDCAEFRVPLPGRKQIEQLWYTGRMHGETVALTISGTRTAYQPGVFFNSAKFFDVEYQTYGNIIPQLPEDQQTLYWEHPAGRKAIRINYLKDSKAVVGFNLMGIRYRQDVCSNWIEQKTSIEVVLENLGAANFDPEFTRQYEAQLVDQYNQQQPGSNLTLKRKRGLFNLIGLYL
jgi:NAD(P)H-nitrite reductase large subunit